MILLDGPMGSELTRRGVDTSAPLWSARALEHAQELAGSAAGGAARTFDVAGSAAGGAARTFDVVRAIHASYAAAGATHHRTNTFRARSRTAGPAWETLARRAVQLARGAVSVAGGLVLGSVGPLEDCYRPDLAPPDDVARREHEEFVALLVAEGVDLLICETFPSAREAAIATSACARTGLETWVSFTAGPSGELMTPRAMAEAARACVGEGAGAVLVNCVAAARTLPFVEALASVHDRVGAYANASPWNEPRISDEEYVAFAREWREAGASIVGSCCGTSAATIKAVAAALR